jgi:hypothetical protein
VVPGFHHGGEGERFLDGGVVIVSTSRDAFLDALRNGSASSWKRRVYDALCAAEPGGRTIDELLVEMRETFRTGLQPAINALHREGWIYRTKRKRPTRTGKLAFVYRVRKHRKPLKQHHCPACGSKISKKQALRVRQLDH